METKEYACDYDFNLDLQNLFRSLNDAHTSYFTKCYNNGNFKSFQPFILTSLVKDDEQIIKIKELAFPDSSTTFFKYWAKETGLDLSKFEGT
jgi:hypothetical protein